MTQLSPLGTGNVPLVTILQELQDAVRNQGPQQSAVTHADIESAINDLEGQRFLGLITGSELFDGQDAIYSYTFQQAALVNASSGAPLFQALTGGITGTAINLAEVTHGLNPGAANPWYVGGVDVHGSTYTAVAFNPKPLGGGGDDAAHKLHQVVELTIRFGQPEEPTFTDSSVYYTFDRQIAHDGTCPGGT